MVGVAVDLPLGVTLLALAFFLLARCLWLWEGFSRFHTLLRWTTIILSGVGYFWWVGRLVVKEYRMEQTASGGGTIESLIRALPDAVAIRVVAALTPHLPVSTSSSIPPAPTPIEKPEISLSVRSAPRIAYAVTVTSGGCLEDTSQFFWTEIKNNSNRFVNIEHISVDVKIKGEGSWTPATIILTVPENVYHLSKDFTSKTPKHVAEAFEYPSLTTAIKASIDPGKQVAGWIMTKPLRADEYTILASRVTVTDGYGHQYIGQVIHKGAQSESPGVDVPKGGYFSIKPLDLERYSQINGLQFCRTRPPWAPAPLAWK
jgi:hypothetical protein